MKISVLVHPNSKKPRIEKDSQGIVHVHLTESPMEGKANQAAIEALAKYFETKKNNVFLISGAKSKSKLFEIISNKSTINLS
jgi:uncharacterized protein (TIGR00251 family)